MCEKLNPVQGFCISVFFPMSALILLSDQVKHLQLSIELLRTRLSLALGAQRTKQNAGSNEVKDINTLIEAINTKNACGIQLTSAYSAKFPGCELLSARHRQGANRGTHYDFEALVKHNGVEAWHTIEHKGSYKYTPIKADERPWDAGVQFHNGGCEKYNLTRKYARTWYDQYIATNYLKSEYGITAPTPSFEDWFKGDCKAQDDPKTEFGKALKAAVRERHGPTASLLEKRQQVNEALDITEEDITLLKTEVMAVANEALKQKERWLTIRGDLTGSFHCAWYPQFTVKHIEEVRVTKKKDISIEFRCNDNFVFEGLLRWGKGAGFSNLRLDMR